MREALRKAIRRIAPGTYTALEKLNRMNLKVLEEDAATRLSERVAELEREVNELRRENRRATELYDLMFARLREDNPLRN